MMWRKIHSEVSSSVSLAALSSGAERLFWRMLSQADPWGRLRGEPTKVRVTCAPLVEWTDTEVESFLDELALAGRIVVYNLDGRLYAALTDFDQWQPECKRKRGQSQLPAPDAGVMAPLFLAQPSGAAKGGEGSEGRRRADKGGEGRPVVEGEESRGEERKSKASPTGSASPSPTQALVAFAVDESDRLGIVLPSRTKGHLASQLKELHDDGMPDEILRAAVASLLERGRPPSALPDIARDLQRKPADPDDLPLGGLRRLTPADQGREWPS